MKFSLEYICERCGGRLSSSADKNREVSGFFSDSRSPDTEKLFLALRGERVDGNSFVPELVKNGCVKVASLTPL